MLNLILTIVVCWNLTFVVNGENGDSGIKYLTATQVTNTIGENVCIAGTALDREFKQLVLSFSLSKLQTTDTDYRKMVVMRDVFTQSTHPP